MIDSGRAGLWIKIDKSRARIAGHSWAMVKIRKAEAGEFGLRAAGRELIRGSLTSLIDIISATGLFDLANAHQCFFLMQIDQAHTLSIAALSRNFAYPRPD